MDSRDAIVVAGLPIAAAFFLHLDPEMEIELLALEGRSVGAGTDLMRLSGKARAMLTAERSALNTVQHLSGIATMTKKYVEAIAGTGCTLLDTRKTIPGLRTLEKYATRMGGATNHRMGLWTRGNDQGQSCRGCRRSGQRSAARRIAASNGSFLKWTHYRRSSPDLRQARPTFCSTIWTSPPSEGGRCGGCGARPDRSLGRRHT